MRTVAGFVRAASTAGKRKRGVSEVAQEEADADTCAALGDTILATLRARSGSMCPSEAPRKLRPANWRCGCGDGAVRACVDTPCRPLMEATRDVARRLAAAGLVVVTQRGVAVPHDQPWRGPVRLQLTAGGRAGGAAGATV